MYRILETIGILGILPVIKIESADKAIPLGQALSDGGLPCVEITFRTDAAEDSISRIASSSHNLIIGAGTILSVDQAKRAVKAGAQFIVSPGFNIRVVNWCLDHNVPIIPGIATPTEIGMALESDLSILKFFPAEAFGGIATLKALAAPFPSIRFIPTGGINLHNLVDYLKLPMVFACGGSWLTPGKLIDNGEFSEIIRLTREAVEYVHRCRNKEDSL